MPRHLEVKVLGDTRDYERALKKAGVETERFAGLTHKLGATAGIAAAAGMGALVLAGEKFAHAAIKAQEETGKLDRAFKNAGFNAEKMSGFVDKAERASRRLGFTNSDTRGALTKFITAGDNAKDAMKDMGLAADYARFKNISLADASQVLIRAHAGNTRALKTLGVNITPVTTAMDKLKEAHKKSKTEITDYEKAIAKSTDANATYSTISTILTKKIGGQADEFSKSAEGGMEQFHAQMGNLEEQAGKHLLPAIAKVTGKLAEIMGIFGGAGSAGDKFTKVLESLGVKSETAQKIVAQTGEAFKVIGSVIEAVWPSVKRAFDILINLVQDFARVVKGMVEIVSGLLHGDFSQVWQGIKDVIGGVVQGIVDELSGAAGLWWNALKGPLDTVFVKPFTSAWNAVADWFTKAEGFVEKVAGYIGGLPKKAWDAYVKLFETVYVKPFKAAFDAVANWLVGPDGFVTKAAGFISGLPGKIADFGGALLSRITGFFTNADVLGFFTGRVSAWAGAIADLPSKIADFSGELITKLTGIIENNAVTKYLEGVPGKFAAFFKDLPSAIGNAALGGVKAGVSIVGDMIDRLFGKLGKWVRGILDIHSPSGEFEKIGHFIVEGLVKGLEQGGFGLKGAIDDLIKEYLKKPFDEIKDDFTDWTSDMFDDLGKIGGLIGVGAGGPNALHLKPGPYTGTHETMGLAGYPAIDQFAPSHSVVYPPDAGKVDRLSGRPWSAGWSDGPGSAIGLSMYFITKAGEYFMTHFDQLFRNAGDTVLPFMPIGTVGPMSETAGGVSSHIHTGFHQFATGGIVTRPTFGLVGEAGPEAVIPLNRAGSVGGPSVIQLLLDGRVLAETVRRQNGRWQSNNGIFAT